MSNIENESRAQFEAAWRERYPDHPPLALKRSGLDPSDYCNTRTKDAWWAWQASRQALVISIPDHYEFRCDTSWEEARQEYYDRALDECRKAIESQGVKCK